MALKVGLIGCGAIGGPVLAALDAGEVPGAACVAVLVRRPRQGAEADPRLVTEADAFFAQAPELIVECAGHEALRQYGPAVATRGTDLMITSMGAFSDATLLAEMEDRARASGCKLILLSASIGALDALTAAREGGLDAVTVTVNSPPAALAESPAGELLDLDALSEPTVVYRGPVREGARLYPKNVNASAAVALAGLGLDRTELVIRADPEPTSHKFSVSATGAFGRFHFDCEFTIDEASRTKIAKIIPMAVIKSIRHYAGHLAIGA
ncbi:MAG: aspartate dehydrogenase [Alphaproteobacteria bacterium]|jgi:aspartate dehydrogenase|nr:aspartate dehydrogenase [Alphaproteobacteria bacterium]